MTTKEYLMQYRILVGRIRRYRERIEQIEASLQKPLQLDGMPKGTTTGDPTSTTAIKLAEIHDRLKKSADESELLRETIADEIEAVNNPIYQELLYSRYILCLTWEEVTDRVSRGRKDRYELKHVMGYLHGNSLKAFEKAKNT